MDYKLIKLKYLFVVAGMVLLCIGCGSTGKMLELPKEHNAGVSRLNEGNHWYKKGCYERALECVFKAHELFSLIDDQTGVAKCYNNLGNIYRAKKDTKSAVLFFNESIRVYETINDKKGIVQAMSNKSAVFIDLEMYDKADSVLNTAETISEKNKFIYPPVLNNRGILLTRSGDREGAKTVLLKALKRIKKEENFEFSAVHFALGNLMVEMKNFKEAERYFLKALETDKKAGYNMGIAADLYAIGALCVETGEIVSALGLLQRSLKIFTLLNDKENSEKTTLLLNSVLKKNNSIKNDAIVTDYFIGLWNDGTRLSVPCE